MNTPEPEHMTEGKNSAEQYPQRNREERRNALRQTPKKFRGERRANPKGERRVPSRR